HGRKSAKGPTVRHTDAMRRGIWFLVLGVLLAALGAASAFAAETTTTTATTTTTTTTSTTSTTTGTTTTSPTTTGTTTTRPAPGYSRLAAAYFSESCVAARAGGNAGAGPRAFSSLEGLRRGRGGGAREAGRGGAAARPAGLQPRPFRLSAESADRPV